MSLIHQKLLINPFLSVNSAMKKLSHPKVQVVSDIQIKQGFLQILEPGSFLNHPFRKKRLSRFHQKKMNLSGNYGLIKSLKFSQVQPLSLDIFNLKIKGKNMENYKIESIKKMIKEKLTDESKFHKDEYYQGRVDAFQFCLDLLADTETTE